MERMKNVYKITIVRGAEKEDFLVFSHSHDNAIKKIKVFLQRKGIIDFEIAKAEILHKNVIY